MEPSVSNAKDPNVDVFMVALVHRRKGEVESLREAILGCPVVIGEQIKWNAPSFCHGGADRVTFRLQPGDRVELVFHRGAKKRADAATFAFDDPTGLLKWLGPDRGIVVLDDPAATEAKSDAIVELVMAWIAATSDA